MQVTYHFHLILKLRLFDDIPPYPYMPSWCLIKKSGILTLLHNLLTSTFAVQSSKNLSHFYNRCPLFSCSASIIMFYNILIAREDC
jgi:hypothetical protein